MGLRSFCKGANRTILDRLVGLKGPKKPVPAAAGVAGAGSLTWSRSWVFSLGVSGAVPPAAAMKGFGIVTIASSADHPTRRDFLFVATGAAAAVGGLTTLWPFISQMNPNASTIAAGAPIEVDLSPIRSKALHYLPMPELQSIEGFLDKLSPILDGDWSNLNLGRMTLGMCMRMGQPASPQAAALQAATQSLRHQLP